MKDALCALSANRLAGFISLAAPDVAEAVALCSQCPARVACATAALADGASLDGSYTRPPSDCVRAGVKCRGNKRTARDLAAIAGVEAPEYRDARPRNRAAEACVNCGTPMIPWTRGDVPEGYVMHYARSFCTECRSAYRATRPARKKRLDGVVRKRVGDGQTSNHTPAAHAERVRFILNHRPADAPVIGPCVDCGAVMRTAHRADNSKIYGRHAGRGLCVDCWPRWSEYVAAVDAQRRRESRRTVTRAGHSAGSAAA